MQTLKVSREPWCVNEFDTFGVFVGKTSNLREGCLAKLGIVIFHGSHFHPASRSVWFLSSLSYNLEFTRYRADSAPIVSLFQCLWEPLCMYPPLIQPLAASVPPPAQCQQSDFEVKPQFILSLRASPRCLRNVGQSIITQPTYLPGLPTALAIDPLASPPNAWPAPRKTLSPHFLPIIAAWLWQ